jgi:hypothetical protein
VQRGNGIGLALLLLHKIKFALRTSEEALPAPTPTSRPGWINDLKEPTEALHVDILERI